MALFSLSTLLKPKVEERKNSGRLHHLIASICSKIQAQKHKHTLLYIRKKDEKKNWCEKCHFASGWMLLRVQHIQYELFYVALISSVNRMKIQMYVHTPDNKITFKIHKCDRTTSLKRTFMRKLWKKLSKWFCHRTTFGCYKQMHMVESRREKRSKQCIWHCAIEWTLAKGIRSLHFVSLGIRFQKNEQ